MSKKTFMEKIINSDYRYDDIDSRVKGSTFKSEARTADRRIKACPKCSFCWEKDYHRTQSTHNRKQGKVKYLYYEDFPTYGKQVKTCPRCKKKETHEYSKIKTR